MSGPFHAGELAAQARAGVTPPGMTGIRPFMPDQHREFFGLLPYLFVATVDEGGWPVATLLTGEPGFVSSPDPTTLDVRALPRAGEPGAELFRAGRPFGALGLDFATRRRNRANGVIEAADARGLRLKVLQSFGNCPQYIQTRAVETAPASAVPAEAVAVDAPEILTQIADADTFFVATVSGSAENGGVDISHRGGLPGFVKIVDSQLVVPDFRGNRFMNTLGNLVEDPRAALLFVDFDTGDLLHLRGRVEIDWDPPAGQDWPEGVQRQWRFRPEAAWRRPAALPLRWEFGDFSSVTLMTKAWNAAA
jgi:predicted pyridoxine 5'-phosphate oxidase superfamily flavin-nucleotide-binding protein